MKPIRPEVPDFSTDFTMKPDGVRVSSWVQGKDTRPWTPAQAFHAGFDRSGTDADAWEWSVRGPNDYAMPTDARVLEAPSEREVRNFAAGPIPPR